MKLIKTFVVVIVGLALSAFTSHAQLTFNFSAVSGATIQFNGTSSSFQFNSSTLVLPPPIGNYYVGSQWSITSEVGGTGSAVGLLGVVNNGPFNYGGITTVINGTDTHETANVVGPLGLMSINDGGGNFLTGNVNWIQVETDDNAGSLNAGLTVNVTSLAYTGVNPDLQTLVAEGPASLDVTFQFSPGMMLSDLTSGTGPYMTSFSGSVSVVPEPATGACLLIGLGVLACTRHFRKK